MGGGGGAAPAGGRRRQVGDNLEEEAGHCGLGREAHADLE